MSFHWAEESTDRMGLCACGIGVAMHKEHSCIPGGCQQNKYKHACNGRTLLPIVPPPARPGEVDCSYEERDRKPDRSLRQRAESHTDIERPNPSAYIADSMQSKPESIQRCRGEKNQDTVGQ